MFKYSKHILTRGCSTLVIEGRLESVTGRMQEESKFSLARPFSFGERIESVIRPMQEGIKFSISWPLGLTRGGKFNSFKQGKQILKKGSKYNFAGPLVFDEYIGSVIMQEGKFIL